MNESKTTDAETINELLETSTNAGMITAHHLISVDSFEMAEAISNWLLDADNGSRDFAIRKNEDVKRNIIDFLKLKDPKHFSIAFEIFA